MRNAGESKPYTHHKEASSLHDLSHRHVYEDLEKYIFETANGSTDSMIRALDLALFMLLFLDRDEFSEHEIKEVGYKLYILKKILSGEGSELLPVTITPSDQGDTIPQDW